MNIRGLIPWKFAELTQIVPIETYLYGDIVSYIRVWLGATVVEQDMSCCWEAKYIPLRVADVRIQIT